MSNLKIHYMPDVITGFNYYCGTVIVHAYACWSGVIIILTTKRQSSILISVIVIVVSGGWIAHWLPYTA